MDEATIALIIFLTVWVVKLSRTVGKLESTVKRVNDELKEIKKLIETLIKS